MWSNTSLCESDPPENCHLNVKKLTFFEKDWQKLSFFAIANFFEKKTIFVNFFEKMSIFTFKWQFSGVSGVNEHNNKWQMVVMFVVLVTEPRLRQIEVWATLDSFLSIVNCHKTKQKIFNFMLIFNSRSLSINIFTLFMLI